MSVLIDILYIFLFEMWQFEIRKFNRKEFVFTNLFMSIHRKYLVCNCVTYSNIQFRSEEKKKKIQILCVMLICSEHFHLCRGGV